MRLTATLNHALRCDAKRTSGGNYLTISVSALKREHGGEVKMPELLSRLVARLSEAASVQRL